MAAHPWHRFYMQVSAGFGIEPKTQIPGTGSCSRQAGVLGAPARLRPLTIPHSSMPPWPGRRHFPSVSADEPGAVEAVPEALSSPVCPQDPATRRQDHCTHGEPANCCTFIIVSALNLSAPHCADSDLPLLACSGHRRARLGEWSFLTYYRHNTEGITIGFKVYDSALHIGSRPFQQSGPLQPWSLRSMSWAVRPKCEGTCSTSTADLGKTVIPASSTRTDINVRVTAAKEAHPCLLMPRA